MKSTNCRSYIFARLSLHSKLHNMMLVAKYSPTTHCSRYLQASKFIVTTEYVVIVVLLIRPNHHHQHFSSNESLNRAVSALARIDGYRRHPRRPRVVELRVWLSSGT